LAVKPWTDPKGRHRYRVEFELGKHRVFRRLPPGSTKAQADALEVKRRRELIDQEILGKTPTIVLKSAIADWLKEHVKGSKAEDETTSKANLVMAALDGELLTKKGIVAAADVVRTMKSLEGGPLAVATINRRLAVLKGTASWAWKHKHWTPENLSPYVVMIDKAKERVRSRQIDQRTIAKLLSKAPHFEAEAFMAFGAYALMREGEVKALAKEHIGRNGIMLPDSKNGEPRVVPIIPQLRSYLKAVPFGRHVRTYYTWFEAARDKAKIRDLTYHDLRRSGATILLNANPPVPLEIVAHIMGNSLEVARKVYARVLNRTAHRLMTKGFGPIKIPSGRKRAAKRIDANA
jgi:integrase